MRHKELIKYLESWAPPGCAWQKDNPGLQLGWKDSELKNVFVCLELNREALKEAIEKGCNFILTHHPLIFNPLKKLDFDSDKKADLIQNLIKKDISLYSAHTNLDFTLGGVSQTIASKLGLKQTRFLSPSEHRQYKITTFIPEESLRPVREALFSAGCGKIGNYEKCGYSSAGTGSFFGNRGSSPQVGRRGNFQEAKELRLEVIAEEWNLQEGLQALRKAHPYEEPAIDVYQLKNIRSNFGAGFIGTLPESMEKDRFLQYVSERLISSCIRYSKGKPGPVSIVATVGGGGSEFLKDAIAQRADAFITADIRYHDFEAADDSIMFMDAGHYETEVHVLGVMAERIKAFLKKQGQPKEVYLFSGSTNPVNYYNLNKE